MIVDQPEWNVTDLNTCIDDVVVLLRACILLIRTPAENPARLRLSGELYVADGTRAIDKGRGIKIS